LAILLVGSLVIGLILIGLGVLTLLFTVICLINTCCCPNYDRHGAPC
jgi:tellurite resistance protein TehA-like permease